MVHRSVLDRCILIVFSVVILPLSKIFSFLFAPSWMVMQGTVSSIFLFLSENSKSSDGTRSMKIWFNYDLPDILLLILTLP